MPGQLSEEIIASRHARLLELVDKIRARKLSKQIGVELEVLVEGPSRRNSERLEGRTRCNKIVVFEGSERHIGQAIKVRIVEATNTTLYGDPAILNFN